MPRQERFELVHTDAGYHGRYRAANGRIVWTTEPYRRSTRVVHAIEQLSSSFATRGVDGRLRVRQRDSLVLEIREVDERDDADD